jgi:hypothetical protein
LALNQTPYFLYRLQKISSGGGGFEQDQQAKMFAFIFKETQAFEEESLKWSTTRFIHMRRVI